MSDECTTNSEARQSHKGSLVSSYYQHETLEPPPDALDDWRQTFERNGFVGPVDILSKEQAETVLDGFEEFVAALPGGKVAGNARFKPHLYVPFCHKLAHHPTIVRLVQALLQTRNILLWSSDFNVKEAKTESCFPPHQDSTYAGLYPPDQVLTVWLAISPRVSRIEGCLTFWKGSHSHGQLLHEETVDQDNMLSRGQRLSGDICGAERVTIPLEWGQATVHSFLAVHQSGPNRGTTPRIGLALRYMTATVRQTGPIRESVTLISGQVQHDGFDLEPTLPANPTADDILRGRQIHASAMQREAENYFQGTKYERYDECNRSED